MDNSKRFELNETDKKRWYHNLLKFLAPVATIYLVSIIAVIQQQNHQITLTDFIPTSFTSGAMALYILNAFLDITSKFVGGNK